ncbi:MAG: mucin9, partial [Pseudonocardiales bacterium]|nr:mucin9 [Pseudonocardiales bacterium]
MPVRLWEGTNFMRFIRRSTMPKIGLRAVVVGSLVAGTLATVVGAASPAQAIGPNAIRTFSNTSTLASTDDGATAKVPLGFSLNFYGTTYSQVIVNENGALTFDRAANANFLNGPLTVFGTKIIAPFSADLDTRPLGSNLVTYGTGTVNGRPSFAATWPGVGCYVNATTTNNSVLNYLQVVLIDRSDTGVGNFDIEFNYDQIKWDTAAEDNTPSAGNSQCVGGTNVWAPRAGYSNGVAADTELTGSGITGTFLDGGVNSLVGHSLNSTQLGRYVFRNPTSTSVAGTLSDGTSSGATLNTDYRKPVTDAAVLSGQTATAGGTITYTAYSNATCTTSVASGGTKPVVNGVPPASNPFNLGAGTYYLLSSYSGDAQNRAASTGCGTQVLTVAPLPVTVTANDRSNTFGDADPAFTFVATGLQGTDRFLTLPSCGVSGAHAGAGTYPITCSGASAGANYTVSYVAGTLTVNPAQATVTADDQSKVYGTADPTFGYHTSSGVTLTTLPTCGVSGVHHDVGNYPIVCNRAVSDTNHTLTYVAGSLKITKAPVVVSPDDQAITFGDPAPLFTYSTTGLLGADTLTNGPTCGVGGPHVDAGTYPIGCSGADAGGNYVISYAVGHLTIAKAAVAVVPNSQAITYGDADPTFTYTVTGLPSGDSLATVPTCQVAGAHSDAGSYAITCSGADAGGNYTIDQSASAGFTVSPRTVTVTAADQAITYGDADPSFTSTATGLVPGDSLSTPATCAVDGTHSDAGSYRITCSAAAASANYDIRYADGTLTVDEAPLTITADSQSAVYGSPDPTLSYTVAVLHDGDQLDAAPTCAVESHHHVGSYAITCSDAAARNYRIVYADGTLTITPATVTITADDQTRIYGNADSRFTYALAGLLGDDSFTTRPTCGVDGSHRDTGTYPITCSDADAGADYTIAYAPGMLAVTPATLHIAASDESTVYGAGDPAFGFQTTGLVGSDTLTAPPACGVDGAHTAARTYPITCSGADGGSDYLIAYSPATLTVNRAGVIVTASDATTVYGTPDPAFGDAVSGLVGDDVLTIEPTCGVDGVHHDVGPYPITCAGADAGDNYTVDYLPGTLMVTKASAVVTPDSQSIVYGDPDPTYAYTTSGLVGGDALVHAAICTVNGTHQDANTYPITCSGADAGGNYTVDYGPGSLTVATAPGVVTPDPQAITYGDPDPTFSYTVSGLKGGDALGTQPTCGVTGSHTAAGHYVIRCSGADAGPDYTLDQSATATLTVRPKAIMVTADNRGITYGQADAAFTS